MVSKLKYMRLYGKPPPPPRVTRCAGVKCGGCELAVSLQDSYDQVLFCEDCYDIVYGSSEESKKDDTPELHWFVTHIDHGVIAGTSRPEIVRKEVSPLGPSAPCLLANSINNKDSTMAVAKAADFLVHADYVLVVAGAGASIDSNLPDFRGRGGWYSLGRTQSQENGARGDEDNRNEELISMDHVDFHPDSPHLLTSWRLAVAMVHAFRHSVPHCGYLELVAALWGLRGFQPANVAGTSINPSAATSPLSASNTPLLPPPSTQPPLLSDPLNAFVITSNIDGYFERAGVPVDALYETHGTMDRMQCTSVGTTAQDACSKSASVWKLPEGERELLELKFRGPEKEANPVLRGGENRRDRAEAIEEPSQKKRRGPCPTIADLPHCRGCGALARPNVSHTTDSDADVCAVRKATQRERALAWIESAKKGTFRPRSGEALSSSGKTIVPSSRLVVLEIGCGISEHSLRLDSELVVARHREAGGDAKLIRIDPGAPVIPAGDGGCVAVALGAKDALIRIIRAARAIKEATFGSSSTAALAALS